MVSKGDIQGTFPSLVFTNDVQRYETVAVLYLQKKKKKKVRLGLNISVGLNDTLLVTF